MPSLMGCGRKIGQFDCCSVVQGDCLELMRSLETWAKPFDVTITDPPYGVGLEYDGFDDSSFNVRELAAAFIPEVVKLSHRVAVTPGVRNLFAYPEPTHTGSFSYPAGAGVTRWGFTCWQPILFYGKDPYGGQGSRPDSHTSYESAEKCGHPCPKPIGQWEWLVQRASREGEVIFDPFLGSGTTAVAAKKLGRHYLGFEISPEYCEIARKRLDAIDAQPTLFAPKVEQMQLCPA